MYVCMHQKNCLIVIQQKSAPSNRRNTYGIDRASARTPSQQASAIIQANGER